MADNRATLRAAIDASGLSARRFAVRALGVDERTVRRWLAGDAEIPAPAARLCRLLAADPELVEWLA